MENDTLNFGDDFNFLLQSNGGMDIIFETPSPETSSNSPSNSENIEPVNFSFFNPQAFDTQRNIYGLSNSQLFVQKQEPIFEQTTQEFVGESAETKQEEQGDSKKRKRGKKQTVEVKQQKETGKGKKIRRKHPEMQTAVTLSREKLLTTSSEEFSNWVEEIKKQRALTQEEIKDIRRQKRLIKNRESAQASRDRKRTEMEKLEEEIFHLKQQRDEALRQLSEMKSKVEVLETENHYMKTTIQQSDVLNNVYEGVSQIQEKAIVPNDKMHLSRNVKNAGVCLFILIFSFGLFFNAQNGFPRPGSILSHPIPNVNVRNTASPSLNAIGTRSRTLLSKVQALGSNLQETSSANILQATSPIVPPTAEKKPSPPLFSIPQVVKTEKFVAPNETNIHTKSEEVASSVHLYCTNAREYSVKNTPTKENDLIISLMIPKTSFSTNSRILPLVKTNDDMVEVKCKVMASL